MIRQVSRKAAALFVVSAATLATTVAMSGTANAVTTKTYSCSKGGFTGYIWFSYLKRPGYDTYIGQIKYRIDKGSQSGGNEANVNWHDGGTLPAINFKTSRGVQDNAYHLLGGDYYRGGGAIYAHFDFDRSHNTDPECGFYIPQP